MIFSLTSPEFPGFDFFDFLFLSFWNSSLDRDVQVYSILRIFLLVEMYSLWLSYEVIALLHPRVDEY